MAARRYRIRVVTSAAYPYIVEHCVGRFHSRAAWHFVIECQTLAEAEAQLAVLKQEHA